MRWLLLLTVILLPFLLPLGATSAEPSPRNQQSIECTAPEELIVHRDETAQTYITVHNQADRNQDITVQSLSVPEPLTTVGLPSNQVLVPNHLKQFPFGIRAAADAAYQNLTITFSVTSDMDPTINETVSLRVTIAPRSDLKFGVDDLASFTVDELVRTSVAVNITNNASYSDDISFSLYTSSSWVWGWTMADTDGAYAYSTVAPGGLSYVYLWVDVPAVTNGAPLAQTGPRFTLSAISGLDKAVTTWSFDLLMNEKKNVSIDAMESSLTLAPNQDGRVNAVVRNTGNTPNTLNITLQGLNPDETPLAGVPASDRFNSDGWVVALFGGLENVVLQPNESRFIEIGFQSPNEFQGEMHVELRVFAEGARADQRVARTFAVIERVSAAEATMDAERCATVAPGSECEVEITVQNTGNAYTTLVLREQSTTGGFDVVVPEAGLLVQPGERKTFPPVVFRAPVDVPAYSLGASTLEVIDDAGAVVDAVEASFTIAPVVNWTFEVIEEQVSVQGRLSIAVEVQNEGNAPDGLVVQLRSSHAVDMGFIPPDTAIYEAGVEHPRSFEINDLPPQSSFTIQAWVQLPQNEANNGTVYINTTVQSKLAPDTLFVHTSTGDYLGEPWHASADEDARIDWSGVASTAVLYVKAWAGVILSVALASLIIYKAVIDRQRRQERAATLPYQEVGETAEDWMSRYQDDQPGQPAPVETPTVSVSNETYQAMFRHQHGSAPPAQPAVEPALVSAANSVLDKGPVSQPSVVVSERVHEPPSPKEAPSPPVDDLEF